MSERRSRTGSGDSRQNASKRDAAAGSSSRYHRHNRSESPPPLEEGLEVIHSSSRPTLTSHNLSTSFAGVTMRRKENSDNNAELTRSQHREHDLEAVQEAPPHMERPSYNSRNSHEARRPVYDHYSHYDNRYGEDYVDRMERSRQRERGELLERSERSEKLGERIDRSTEFSKGSMSVVSDVSYGDKPYHSMPVISLAQDSGSLLPHLNTSHKSTCSMTHGSKRMAEKRAALLRSGSILYCDETQEKKKREDKDLEFTRWGGRKDYSQRTYNSTSNTRKLALTKHHQREVKAEKRASMEKHDSFRSISEKEGHGFHDLWGFAFKKEMLDYEQLISEDKDRELVASFCEEPFWRIIFHFKGTVLKVIIEDILFWLTIATYCSIRIQFRLNDSYINYIDNDVLSDNLVYMAGFLLFFLVFYVNQNHHRYFDLHKDSMVLMGRVNDVATLVKAVLPMERARRINRFMNAAHVAMYTGLSSTYEKENFFDPLEARFALLTDEELYRVVEEIDVDNSGPKAAFEIISWIMCDIRDAQINSFIDTNEAMQLREQLLDFRSTIAKIFVTTTLPIPFFYVHFLSLLTAIFLPLFAVVMAYDTGPVIDKNTWVLEIVSGLVVFLQALFVIGLRILGQQLSDPYGGDLIDLQIARYVNMILNGSNQILAAKRLHPPSIETELRLQLKMSSLGQAFEYDTDDEVVIQH